MRTLETRNLEAEELPGSACRASGRTHERHGTNFSELQEG